MPRRLTKTQEGTHNALKNSSFESLVVSWLMHDGWQVFVPILDHGHKTDILISDGPQYFRIQVKTVDASSKDHPIENQWRDSGIDVVVAFARSAEWGYVMPAFTEKKRKLSAEGHQMFSRRRTKEFLKAFHKLEI